MSKKLQHLQTDFTVEYDETDSPSNFIRKDYL